MKKKILKRRKKMVTPKTDYFVENNKTPHYSDATSLKMFLTERGKIFARTRSGLTAKNQRKLALAIKHARHLSLLPFLSRG